MKYKLIPILRCLGACPESIDWLAQNEFDTFKEAWDNCNIMWVDWVVEQLQSVSCYDQPWYTEAADLWEEGERVWEDLCSSGAGHLEQQYERMVEFREFYNPHREKIEQWLIQYALVADCAEECDEVEVATNP